jgi:hypothetical protein
MLLTANLILVSPAILVLTVIAVFGVKWLGCWPDGVPGIVMAPLIFSSFYALLSLYVVIDAFIVTPARLQRRYVGYVYGSPVSLIGYESGGFQDPYQIWRYRIDAATASSLRQRCRKDVSDGAGRCVLFSEQDDRWFASVTLDRDVLEVQDGLW